MLQNQFAASSVAGSANSIIATASESGYADDSEDYSDGDDVFEFPTASVVSSRDEIGPSALGPRAGKGPGKGRWSQGNVNSTSSFNASKNQKEDRNENEWSKVPQNFTNRTFRKVIEDDDICPVHGVVCSKGICSVMKKKKWEKERAEKRKEREKEKEQRKRRREAEKNGTPFAEDEEVAEAQGADDAETREKAESVTISAPSVAGSGRSIGSKKSGDASSTIIGSGIKGDWGPKKGWSLFHSHVQSIFQL